MAVKPREGGRSPRDGVDPVSAIILELNQCLVPPEACGGRYAGRDPATRVRKEADALRARELVGAIHAVGMGSKIDSFSGRLGVNPTVDLITEKTAVHWLFDAAKRDPQSVVKIQSELIEQNPHTRDALKAAQELLNWLIDDWCGTNLHLTGTVDGVEPK